MFAHTIGFPLGLLGDYSTFLSRSGTELLRQLSQHVQIVAITLVIAVPIAIGLGVLATLDDRLAKAILWATGIMLTVPSIAFFGLLIPFLGIGEPPVIVALVLYAQMPIARNTYLGIQQVPQASIDAGEGLGMTGRQLLWRVQLPEAMPVIMSGVRNAVVIIIGIAAIGAFIGAGGLGDFIFTGISRANTTMIVVTTVTLSALALAVDYGLGVLEQWLRLRNGEPVEGGAGASLLGRVVG